MSATPGMTEVTVKQLCNGLKVNMVQPKLMCGFVLRYYPCNVNLTLLLNLQIILVGTVKNICKARGFI